MAGQHEPLSAVALMRPAAPAQRVRAIPVVFKAVEAVATDRTQHLVSAVAKHLQPSLQTGGDAASVEALANRPPAEVRGIGLRPSRDRPHAPMLGRSPAPVALR